MKLTAGKNEAIQDPNLAQVIEALQDMGSGAGNFCILERRPGDYLQVAGNAAGGFLLEYQQGGPSQHYQATEIVTPEQARAVFQGYLENQVGWRGDLKWETLDLPPAPPLSGFWAWLFTVMSRKVWRLPLGIWTMIALVLCAGVYIAALFVLPLDMSIERRVQALTAAATTAVISLTVIAIWLFIQRFARISERFVTVEAVVTSLKRQPGGEDGVPSFQARVQYVTPNGTVRRWLGISQITLMSLRVGDRTRIKYDPLHVRRAQWVGGRVKHAISGINAWKNVEAFRKEYESWQGKDKKYFRRPNYRLAVGFGLMMTAYYALGQLLGLAFGGRLVPWLFLTALLLRFIGWSLLGILAAALLRPLVYRERRLQPYRADLGRFVRYEAVSAQNVVDCPFCSTPVPPGVWKCPYCEMALSLWFPLVIVCPFLFLLALIPWVTGNFAAAIQRTVLLLLVVGYGLRDGLLWRRGRRWPGG